MYIVFLHWIKFTKTSRKYFLIISIVIAIICRTIIVMAIELREINKSCESDRSKGSSLK